MQCNSSLKKKWKYVFMQSFHRFLEKMWRFLNQKLCANRRNETFVGYKTDKIINIIKTHNVSFLLSFCPSTKLPINKIISCLFQRRLNVFLEFKSLFMIQWTHQAEVIIFILDFLTGNWTKSFNYQFFWFHYSILQNYQA